MGLRERPASSGTRRSGSGLLSLRRDRTDGVPTYPRSWLHGGSQLGAPAVRMKLRLLPEALSSPSFHNTGRVPSVSLSVVLAGTAVCARRQVFARRDRSSPCSCMPCAATCLPRAVRVWCAPRCLGWPDLAEGRLRLDRLCRNGGRQLFSAAASGFASRSKIAVARHPPLRCGSQAASASSIASGRTIAIEAAMGATR